MSWSCVRWGIPVLELTLCEENAFNLVKCARSRSARIVLTLLFEALQQRDTASESLCDRATLAGDFVIEILRPQTLFRVRICKPIRSYYECALGSRLPTDVCFDRFLYTCTSICIWNENNRVEKKQKQRFPLKLQLRSLYWLGGVPQ